MSQVQGCLESLPGDRFAPVGRALCAEVDQHHVPGAAVAVALDGHLAWTFATGRRCQSREAPVTPDTPFRIGSLTKLMTAAVGLDLEHTGVLRLDDPVSRYLPDIRMSGGDPSIRDLLMHRSGLQEVMAAPGQRDQPITAIGPFSIERPGTFRYTNAGYGLAGAAIAAAAETDLADLIKARLATPAGLPSLQLASGNPVGAAACGHTLLGGELTVEQDFASLAHGATWTAPSGAAVASAVDLVRLALATEPGQRLEHLRALWAETVPTTDGDPYGLGIRVRHLPDGRVLLHHAGNTGTFFAELYWLPDSGFAAAVVANRPRPLRATITAALALLDENLTP